MYPNDSAAKMCEFSDGMWKLTSEMDANFWQHSTEQGPASKHLLSWKQVPAHHHGQQVRAHSRDQQGRDHRHGQDYRQVYAQAVECEIVMTA